MKHIEITEMILYLLE